MLDGQAIIQERAVTQTFLNNTSINADAFKNDLSAVAGYPEGRIIYVTYYSQNAPLADVRSRNADMTTQSKDDVHISWTEIRNFELRLSSSMEFEYDEASNVSKIRGEALVFAGFVPRISDIFLYELRNGKIGIFRISGIRRLAIGQDTYHQVSYTLQEWLETVTRDRFRRQTTAVFYFDKSKFLMGNHAMLTTQGYIDQKELRHVRAEIIHNYLDRFYDNSMSSFIRPDGLYDPYVVEYWNHKIGYEDYGTHGYRHRPTQLLISVSNYHKTIWSVLTINPIKSLKNVAKNWSTSTLHATFWSVNVTSLLEHEFITVGDEEGATSYPTIDHRGDPQLMDVSPPFYPLIWSEDIKKRADALFHSFRHWYYNDIAPHRTCPPHVHVDRNPYPFDPVLCHGCKFMDHCEFNPDHKPHPGKPECTPNHVIYKPPYPIRSDHELELIWRAMNHIDFGLELDRSLQAEFDAYRKWYRKEYDGTLTKYELERNWRTAHKIPADQALTAEQLAKLQEHIDYYRSQRLRVLSRDEIEIMWRTYNRIPAAQVLTPEQGKKLQETIVAYRELHGSPVDDQVVPGEIPDYMSTDETFLRWDHVPGIYYPDQSQVPPAAKPWVPNHPKPIKPGPDYRPPMEMGGPPFPVLSDEELFFIWKRIHHIPEDKILTESDWAKLRGYILWYRNTYPGTLSEVELEEEWRAQAGLDPDHELTPEERAGLDQYIDSYRSKFLPVLTDRELEIMWRTHNGVPLGDPTTDVQKKQLHTFIERYRSMHGRVPRDAEIDDYPVIGDPITPEEVAAAGAVMYCDRVIVDLEPPSLTELTAAMEGKLPPPKDPIPAEYVPTVYYPKFHHHHFCPNMCHFLCEKTPCFPKDETEDDSNSYALSNEFYLGSVAMDPFEKILYDLITGKEVAPGLILEAVSSYLDWSDEDAFYRSLFAIFMIDRALYWLRFHS